MPANPRPAGPCAAQSRHNRAVARAVSPNRCARPAPQGGRRAPGPVGSTSLAGQRVQAQARPQAPAAGDPAGCSSRKRRRSPPRRSGRRPWGGPRPSQEAGDRQGSKVPGRGPACVCSNHALAVDGVDFSSVGCATSKPTHPMRTAARRWYPECVGQRADGTLVTRLEGSFSGAAPRCGQNRVGTTEIMLEEPPGRGSPRSRSRCEVPFELIKATLER